MSEQEKQGRPDNHDNGKSEEAKSKTDNNRASSTDSEEKRGGEASREAMMFAFDDQSPQATPTKASPSPSTGSAHSPSNSPRAKKPNTGANFMTQSSPPRFVSFDEIMKAANGVTNMTLAHEIAVDNDFRFQKQEPPSNSLEKQVRDIVHRAFWDVLSEQLSEDPPEFDQAIVLLSEVKQNVLDLLLPHQQRLQGQIEEVLDLDLIHGALADHGALDFQYYADFVISIMARLCAPARDDDIARLKSITEVVPLYKEIFAVLDLLKLDMANFTIQQIRPYIQQQSVEYERTKFRELLKQQEDSGRDSLECTKSWLQRSADRISMETKARQTGTPGGEATSLSISPAAIMNSAYTELLDWPENLLYPETLLMDQKRFVDLCEKSHWLALMASVLTVTYNMVGDPIAGVRSFKEKLKNAMMVIIGQTPFKDVSGIMANISEQVVKEVSDCLSEHGYPPMVDDRVSMLKSVIESVGSEEQPVHKVLRKRLLDVIRVLLSSPGSKQIQVPSGYASMAEEFSHVYGQFLRLVSHNRTVYGVYYADIISSYMNVAKSGSSGGEPETKS